MKTDNSNYGVSVKTELQSASYKNAGALAKSIGFGYESICFEVAEKSFENAANWQKKQYKPILESHAELLKWVKDLRGAMAMEISEFNIPLLNDAIEKAEKLNIQ